MSAYTINQITSEGSHVWTCAASSANGQVLAVGYNDLSEGKEIIGQVVVSTDGGSTWTSHDITGEAGTPVLESATGCIQNISMSADGSKIVVGTSSGFALAAGPIYYSYNFGTTWIQPFYMQGETLVELTNISFYPKAIKISPDGSKIIYNSSSYDLRYVMTNDFSNNGTLPVNNMVSSIDCNIDGSIIYVTDKVSVFRIQENMSEYNLFTITPFGVNWAEIVCSSDGSTVYACQDISTGANISIYKSTNSGTSWTECILIPDGNSSFISIAISSDGSVVHVLINLSNWTYSLDGATTFEPAETIPISFASSIICNPGTGGQFVLVFNQDNSFMKIGTLNNLQPPQEPVACYGPKSMIFCYDTAQDCERYIPIEDINASKHLVKTIGHGYRKISNILSGTFANDPESNGFRCMYKLSKHKHDGLIADLHLTGLHSIYLSKDSKAQMVRDLHEFEALEKDVRCTYYHLCLENSDPDSNYQILVNGIRSESVSKTAIDLCMHSGQFSRHSIFVN